MFIQRGKYHTEAFPQHTGHPSVESSHHGKVQGPGGFEALSGSCELKAIFITGTRYLPFSASFPAAPGSCYREKTEADVRIQPSVTV